ncbi:MAG: chemotaxis protein CheW [Deltaproteobacteria bacterium]|jgi:chemotaxis protein histidine kinase CheA|nr:chemotaxis protein CheW [Deltaproteobacteria bacterium]
MSFDTDKLTELLNRASMDLVMLSPDNLLEISSLLGITEELGREFTRFESEWPPKVSNSLKAILRGLMRDEIPDRDEALDAAGNALGILQELSRDLPTGTPVTADIPEFLKKAGRLAPEDSPLDPAGFEDEGRETGEETGAETGEETGEETSAETAVAEGTGESPDAAEASPKTERADEKTLYPEGERNTSDDIDEGWGPEDAARGGESGEESGEGDGERAEKAEEGAEEGAEAEEVGEIGGEAPAAAAASQASRDAGEAPDQSPPAAAESAPAPPVPAATGKRGWTCKYNYFLDQTLTPEYFKADFTQELESLQMKLVTVEQKSDTSAAMAETLPSFRTILGGLSLLGLDELTWLTADTLGLIDYVSTEQVQHSTKITDILIKALHFIINGLSTLRIRPDGKSWAISPDWDPSELEQLKEGLWEARQGILPGDAKGSAPAISSGASYGAKPKKLGEILVEKGLISEGDLGGLIQAQKTARNMRLGEILVQESYVTEAELNEALRRQENEDKGRRLGEILVSMGRLDHEHLDKALKIQESMKETKLGEFILKRKIGAPEKVAAALREQKQSEGGIPQTPGTHTVKVETQKLDGLIDLVGELVITQSLVTSNDSIKILKEQKINKDLAQVSRITSELQRNAMSLRMVQINNTFRKMNRLVRDLAHKFEKDVEFLTSGDDTEIDRNMVESIYDPLVHMIRNALDHGLEPPRERKDRGKSPKGQLSLKAYHQGGNVVIELSDDGRGLNVEKVIQKAREAGLVQPGEVVSKAQAHNLVFQPGFSTSDAITDTSGRGIGMDVVRKSIEQLRGKVDFTSEPGQGSTITIRLPLTLAIIDGMIVRVGDNRYILPTISINESFRPKPEEYFTVKNQGEMIKVRDNLLPLVRLDQIVNVRGAIRDPSDALVVVIENEGQRRCLLVDEVLGKQEVVIKSLGERLKYVRALAGGTILGDGRVGLILDINGLFEVGESLFAPSAGRGGSGNSGSAGAPEDWGM